LYVSFVSSRQMREKSCVPGGIQERNSAGELVVYLGPSLMDEAAAKLKPLTLIAPNSNR